MLTSKHFAILTQLRNDARLSLAEVSRRTGIASSTVFDYYQDLFEEAVIKHAAMPDFKKLGYPLRKKFLVRGKQRDKVLAWLKNHGLVNNLYRVDGWDAYFDAYFTDANELETFRETLAQELQPRSLQELDVLEELKHEAFMPVQDKF